MSSTIHRAKYSAIDPCNTVRNRVPTHVANPLVRFGIVAGCLLAAVAQVATAEDYKSFDEAMAAAKKALATKNYLGSEEPLEAAVKLADDDAKRIEAYRLLIDAYKLHPEIDDVLKACEFIVDHTKNSAERFIFRDKLLDFVEEREKADDLIGHFEKRLKTDENDRTALIMLSNAYAQLKEDPEKSVELTERLEKVIDSADEKGDVVTYSELAKQYVNSKKYRKGAELYEKIAPQDKEKEPWHWKEAALAWLKAGEKEKALQAAMNSTKAGPETRPLLPYYWNSELGDVYLELGNPMLAISHYEKALKATRIKRYLDITNKKLKEAREQAK